jgi:ABC-type bacteriocin/lantibiotic exporter with double-glycine peptidase domain
MKIENEKDLKSVEKYLLKHVRAWKWASLKDISTKGVYHYYHPNTGIQRLSLEAYKEQFTAYSLYIIPTSSYKRKTGTTKGKSQRIYDLEQIDQYWTKDVLRIDVYVEGKKINSYENGRFLK